MTLNKPNEGRFRNGGAHEEPPLHREDLKPGFSFAWLSHQEISDFSFVDGPES